MPKIESSQKKLLKNRKKLHNYKTSNANLKWFNIGNDAAKKKKQEWFFQKLLDKYLDCLEQTNRNET